MVWVLVVFFQEKWGGSSKYHLYEFRGIAYVYYQLDGGYICSDANDLTAAVIGTSDVCLLRMHQKVVVKDFFEPPYLYIGWIER